MRPLLLLFRFWLFSLCFPFLRHFSPFVDRGWCVFFPSLSPRYSLLDNFVQSQVPLCFPQVSYLTLPSLSVTAITRGNNSRKKDTYEGETDMNITVTYTNKQHQVVNTIVNSFPSVSVFWKSVASFIKESAVPSRITAVSENNGVAHISVKRRGKGKESLYTEVADETYGLANSPFSERYLVSGNKGYVLSPIEDENGIISFNAVYGNSDEILSGKGKSVKSPYPITEFWVKYYEKLAKGYKDRSRILSLSRKSLADNDAGQELFNALYNDAKSHLPVSSLANRLRNIDKISLTEVQIAKAWKVFRQLKKAKRFKTFRTVYLTLASILPKTCLADDVTVATMERKDSLFREIDSTLSDMENIVACKSSFADCGVTINKADKAETERVKALLSSDIASRVEAVYTVSNPVKTERFNSYCARRNITTTKELWHGSRNENWLSIIKNGLRLHPNASITGKMFGDGIYFAPEAKKSYGYTSCQGTYWANGSSTYGFMGLFTTAYGTPCHDDNRFYRYNSNPQKALTRMKCGCLHALASRTSLRHDEIVFYHEDAVMLSYLVKIKS